MEILTICPILLGTIPLTFQLTCGIGIIWEEEGGSLEQIIGSVDTVKNAVDEGGLVNLYWIGRVNEATIRHDSAIEDYIVNDADAWPLTTWGQSWSYWAKNKCYEFDHSITPQGESYVLNFQSLVKEQCTNLLPERWNVPIRGL